MKPSFPSPQDDCFAILGVGIDATVADVIAAARKLTRLYHPDRFASADSDTQAQAELAAMLVNDAQKKLGDVFLRANYLLQHRYNVQLYDIRHLQPAGDLFQRILETQEFLMDLDSNEPLPREEQQMIAKQLSEYQSDFQGCADRLWNAFTLRANTSLPLTPDYTDIAEPLMLHGYLVRVMRGLEKVLV